MQIVMILIWKRIHLIANAYLKWNSANATHDACASFDCEEQIVNDENKSRPIFSIRLICIYIFLFVSSDAASNKPIQKEDLNKPNRFLNRTLFHLSHSLCVYVLCANLYFTAYAFFFFLFIRLLHNYTQRT